MTQAVAASHGPCATCGQEIHTPRSTLEHGSGGTGYGIDEQGNKHCYACCADRERARMIETGRACLYLVRNRQGQWEITDWAGQLRFQHVMVRTREHGHFVPNYGYTVRQDAWFVGPRGRLWHGVVKGDMQLIRCKRLADTPDNRQDARALERRH